MYMRERFHDVLPPMQDAISFDVTQAAQWFLRDDEKEEYDLVDYPALVAPYPSMWMEYVFPAMLRVEKELTPKPSRLKSIGCYLHTAEIPPNIVDSICGHEVEFLRVSLEAWTGKADMESGPMPPVNNTNPAKWVSVGLICESSDELCLVVYAFAMLLDERGKYIFRLGLPVPLNLVRVLSGRGTDYAALVLRSMDSDELIDMTEILVNVESPFMFCLSLLHCRNVNVVDTPPQPAPILEQRAKKGIPYIQYKTLEVTPLRTVRQGGTRKDGTPEPKALHFVRGHFKDFSDKGLFGKYKGVYWWDSQVRGDVGKGIVDKDYRVSRD